MLFAPPSLKLVVFGGTGKTGRLLVEQALADGHEVTILVRSLTRVIEAGLPGSHERLYIVQGDVRDLERVEEAVRGQNIVLSVLGQTRSSGAGVLTVAARHLVAAMQKHGVGRLVSLVGAGVADPRDEGSLGRRFMRGLLKIAARSILEDAEAHAALVRASDLSWTLVRPPRLVDGPKRGGYRTGYLALGPNDVLSRADLADFMLRLATHGGYEREAPMVSY